MRESSRFVCVRNFGNQSAQQRDGIDVVQFSTFHLSSGEGQESGAHRSVKKSDKRCDRDCTFDGTGWAQRCFHSSATFCSISSSELALPNRTKKSLDNCRSAIPSPVQWAAQISKSNSTTRSPSLESVACSTSGSAELEGVEGGVGN
jgi:hypothetical protein